MSWSKRRKIFETTTLSFKNFDMLFRMTLNPKPSVKVTETYKLNWGSHPTKCHPSSWKMIFRTPGGLEFCSWEPPMKTGFAIAMSPETTPKIYITHTHTSGGCCLSRFLPGHSDCGFKPLFFVFLPNKGNNFLSNPPKTKGRSEWQIPCYPMILKILGF